MLCEYLPICKVWCVTKVVLWSYYVVIVEKVSVPALQSWTKYLVKNCGTIRFNACPPSPQVNALVLGRNDTQNNPQISIDTGGRGERELLCFLSYILSMIAVPSISKSPKHMLTFSNRIRKEYVTEV